MPEHNPPAPWGPQAARAVVFACELVILSTVIWLSVYWYTGNLAICLLVYRAWARPVTTHWACSLSPGIPGDPWDPRGSLGFHGIPGISWDPWGFMGSLGSQGTPGISWDPWEFMGSLGSLGFHGIPGIGISWDLWDSQAANQVQGAGGRGRQPLG